MMTALSWQDITCPACGAPPNAPCMTGTGRRSQDPHSLRRHAVTEANVGTPLLGYALHETTPHAVSAADRERALCGTALVSWPLLQPPTSQMHALCRSLLGKVAAEPASTSGTGVCPVCGAEEQLDADRLPAHKQLVVGRGGIVRSSVDCPGAGELPETTS